MSEGWVQFLTPTATHRQLGLNCLSVGQKRTVTACGWRTLSCYGAVLVLEGRGHLEVDDQVLELEAPALFWLCPTVPHRYGPDKNGWREMWTLFEGPAAAGYGELGYLAAPLCPLSDPTTVRYAMDRLLAICRDQVPRVDAEAAHLVHELILASQRNQDTSRESVDARILTVLQDAALTSASVTEIARRLRLSSSSLRRAVQRAAACTPKEYVLRIRFNRAKELLAGSELTIAQTSSAVGIEDPAYFSRIFTRREGMPPRTFRRLQRRQ